MGLFSNRKEQLKEHTSPAQNGTTSSEKTGRKRSTTRIPKLATLFSETAEDGSFQRTSTTQDMDAITAPTIDMDEFGVEEQIPIKEGPQVAMVTGGYKDDDRNFSAISTCGNQRALRKSCSRHDAILKRADSISLMAKRDSIKRSVSRKIARSESRRHSLALSSHKEKSGVEDDHVTKNSSSASLLPNHEVSEVDNLLSKFSLSGSPAPTDGSDAHGQRPNGGEESLSAAMNPPNEHTSIVTDFEKAYGEDDAFIVEEATRNDFATKSGVNGGLTNECVAAGCKNTEDGVASAGTGVTFTTSALDENSKTSKAAVTDLKRGRSRRRPPPLISADEGKSSDPVSDWPHTSVFGKDGGFTTGGFKITSEGMVGKPPIATRKDSDPQEDGEVPQSDRNLVIVRSLKEFRAGPTIGAGAAGRVYLAEHAPSKRTMAMKVVNVYDKEKRNQLLKELETLSTHVSRYLVRFYGAFYDGSGAVHIALEYMDHGCLSSFVQKVGAIPEKVVQMIAIDCLRGLRFLHRHHVLHRDFKTANILLSRRLCCAKLSDFGLARDLNPGVSRVETFVGTVAYMSPERLQGSKYTYASDIWALGVSIVECLLGRYPFNKPQSYFDYIDATMATDMWKGFHQTGIPVSEQAKDFVMQCTFSDPNRRPDTSTLLEHPWVAGVKKDGELFGSWLDHCRIRSMAVVNRGPKR